MSSVGHAVRLLVRGSHPSLKGHFPDNAIVPGVMILESVAAELKVWRGLRLAKVLEAKFMAPLLPEQSAELVMTEKGNGRFGFTVTLDDRTLVRGVIEGKV